MFGFDHTTIGAYTPPDYFPLIDAVIELVEAYNTASIQAMEDMLNCDLVDQDACKFIIEEKEGLEILGASDALMSDPVIVERGWKSLWQHLIEGTVIAKAVDNRCYVHSVEAYFWTTPQAKHTLFSGYLNETPPYRPHGRVILSQKSLDKLYMTAYNIAYQSILPSAPGSFYDQISVEDYYSNSLLGEAEENSKKRSGTHKQIDSEAYLIEVFALIQQERFFKSKSELARRASDAFVANAAGRQRPSIKWAESLVGKVWDRLGLTNTSVNDLRRMKDSAP